MVTIKYCEFVDEAMYKNDVDGAHVIVEKGQD